MRITRWLLPLATLAALTTLTACQRQPSTPAMATTKARVDPGTVTKLTIKDIKLGTGPVAQPGMEVSVQYTGWLYDKNARDLHGQEFDSTHKRNDTPLRFTLGTGQVIKGWDQGVAGMRVGGVRQLLIPASLGYGSRGAGGVIPPNASLVFRVTLVDAATP